MGWTIREHLSRLTLISIRCTHGRTADHSATCVFHHAGKLTEVLRLQCELDQEQEQNERAVSPQSVRRFQDDHEDLSHQVNAAQPVILAPRKELKYKQHDELHDKEFAFRPVRARTERVCERTTCFRVQYL